MTVNNGTNVTCSVAFQVAFVLKVSVALLDVAVVCGIVSQFSRGKKALYLQVCSVHLGYICSEICFSLWKSRRMEECQSTTKVSEAVREFLRFLVSELLEE